MGVGARLYGAEGVRKAFLAAPQTYKNALLAALYSEGLRLIASADRHIPVRTGRLRDSHYCRPVRGYAGKDPWVKCSYAAPYAAAVHERTDVVHLSGGAKYMDRAVAEVIGGFSERVAAMVRRGIETKLDISQIPSNGVPVRAIRRESATVRAARAKAFGKGESASFDSALFKLLRKARRNAKAPKG